MTPEESQERVEEGREEEVLDEAKVDWNEPSMEVPENQDAPSEAGVQIGLSPLGPMIQVTSPEGETVQKLISVEECFLLAGQLTGIGSFIMGMGMQAQMAEQARIQQMMAEGGKKSAGGVYLK